MPREGGGYWHPYEVEFSWGVAGALTAYDLPDLIGAIAPRKIILAGLIDAQLEPASEQLINTEMSFPRAAYTSKQAGGQLEIKSTTDNLLTLVDACFK
jgi:hypothetical protein